MNGGCIERMVMPMDENRFRGGCIKRIEFDTVPISTNKTNRYDTTRFRYLIRGMFRSVYICTKTRGCQGMEGKITLDISMYRKFDILMYRNFRYDIQQ